MGWCHGITQGHLRIFHDMVSPAEWWSSSWSAPRCRWGGGQNVDGLGAGLQTADVSEGSRRSFRIVVVRGGCPVRVSIEAFVT